MTSKIGAVRSYIRGEIDGLVYDGGTAAIESCGDSFSAKRTKMPYAFIGWEGGAYKGEMNARVLQLVVPFEVEVTAGDVDTTDEVMEAIEAAFLTTARVAALGALGVAYVRPVDKYIPAGQEGGKSFLGVLNMELMLKRTVTS